MRLKAVLFLSSAALAAGAAEFVVTNFTGSLHDAATYENAAVPGADDVIAWTNAATHTLESPLAVKGIRVNLATSGHQVNISGAALTIGESGVVHEKGTLSFKAPVVLATNQTWSVPVSGNSMNVADLSGPDCVLTTTGSGNVLYLGPVDVREICCSNAPSFLRVDARLSATTCVRTYPDKTLYEDMSKDFNLPEVLPLAATTNLNGILMLGRYAYNPQKLDVTVTLQPGDRLRITVFSRDRELTDLFNLNDRSGGGGSNNGNDRHPYTVRTDGTVEIPTIGPVRVQGLTRQQVADEIKYQLLSSKLLLDPTVIVEYYDLAITVLGEVGHPGRLQIPTDQLTILDALALAGDLTIYGKRENIMVLRTKDNVQTPYVIDLTNSRSVYESPVYYLQQNDIVYVEPNVKKATQSDQNASTLRSLGFWMSIPSYVVTLVVLFTRNK